MRIWLLFFLFLAPFTAGAQNVPKWNVHEITLTASREYKNPYLEAAVEATFTGPHNAKKRVKGFWDGDRVFKIRFTPDIEGRWSYRTSSADPGLNGKDGTLNCVPAEKSNHGFVRRDPQYSRYFVYDDGSRYFMLGTTYYEIISNALQGTKYKESIDNLVKYGINKIRFRMNIKTCNNADNPYPCSSPYGRTHDEINIAHMKAADRVLDYMKERGIVADFLIFDSKDSFYGTNAQDERYLRYILSRYAAYNNVIWCLSNEWQVVKVKDRKFWNNMGWIVRKEDQWLTNGPLLRPLSIHPYGGRTQGDTFAYYNEQWPIHAILQAGRTVPGDLVAHLVLDDTASYDLPVINDEYGYMGDWLGKWKEYTPELHRHSMWGVYIGGGHGSTGDKFSYSDGRPYKSSNWHDRAEYRDVLHMSNFFTKRGIEYWKTSPDNKLINYADRVYIMAEPGRQYIIYAANGGDFKLELPAGDFRAMRFDPRTGEELELANLTGGGLASLTVPEGKDWALYISRK
jgi:hypothetical protein